MNQKLFFKFKEMYRFLKFKCNDIVVQMDNFWVYIYKLDWGKDKNYFSNHFVN